MAVSSELVKTIALGGQIAPIDSTLFATYGWVTFQPAEDTGLDPICERAIGLLIEQFKTKPNIQGYLCALLKGAVSVDATLKDLNTLRTISTAEGAQLDGLGDLLGVERNGLSDADYRQAILFQRTINASNGEPETLLSLLSEITGGDQVQLNENYPAGVILYTNGGVITTETVSRLKKAAPAGVRVSLTAGYGATTPFAFEPDAGGSDPLSAGFFEPNYAPDAGSGGELSERIS